MVFFFLILLIVGSVLVISKFSVYLRPLYQLTFNKKIELKKTEDQRINILLLGIGGGRHDGPLLTDTIIFASVNPAKKNVTLISIPRDLWIPEEHVKINSVYALSEEKKPGSGLQKIKQLVSNVVGQPVDYGFRIDFTGFIKVIDILGGVDVDVDRAFDDYAYPLSGKETDLCGRLEDEMATISAQIATGSAEVAEFFPCRFEQLSFSQGLQHMEGEQALKFVRSRHALGPEGTDFARSKRQEKVIKAVKEKVFSVQSYLNPVKDIEIFNTVKNSIDTDIKDEEIDDFIKLADKMRTAKIITGVLDLGDGETIASGLMTNPPTGEEFGYQWVVVPTAGTEDYSQIHAYVKCMIEYSTTCALATPSPQITQ